MCVKQEQKALLCWTGVFMDHCPASKHVKQDATGSCAAQAERAFVSHVTKRPRKEGHSRDAGFHDAAQAVSRQLVAHGLQCSCHVGS